MTKPKSATSNPANPNRWDPTIAEAFPSFGPHSRDLLKSLMQTAYLIGKVEGITHATKILGHDPLSQPQPKDTRP
jgi:hypothetical protein